MRHIVLFLALAVFFFAVPVAQARQGCCSYHSGVRADGCSCNDGTPLSATCQPYYVCSRDDAGAAARLPAAVTVPPTVAPIHLPTRVPTKLPTKAAVSVLTRVPSRLPTRKPTPGPTKSVAIPTPVHVAQPQTDDGFFGWLFRLFHGGK